MRKPEIRTHSPSTALLAACVVAIFPLLTQPVSAGTMRLSNVGGSAEVDLESNGDFTTNGDVHTGVPASPDQGSFTITRDGDTKIVVTDTDMHVKNGVRQDNISPGLSGDLEIEDPSVPGSAPQAVIGSQGETEGVLSVSGDAECVGNAVYTVVYVDDFAVWEQNDAGEPIQFAYANIPSQEGVEGRTVYDTGEPANLYYLKDHLNSSRIVVDEDGTPVEGIAYHAYGKTDILLEAPSAGGSNSVREKFTGKEHDLDGADDGLGVKGIALDYFGFRYYDAEVGVWTCADPAMEFYHGYSYVGGEPVTTVDPLGLSTFKEFSGALDDMAVDASGDDYAQDGNSIVLSGNDDDNTDGGGNQGGSNLDPDVSPLSVGTNTGALSNSGGDLGSYAPGTPNANTESSGGGGGSLTEHDYTAEAMSGKGGGKGGVTSQDIEKNKARAKEKSGEYTRAGSDVQPAGGRKGEIGFMEDLKLGLKWMIGGERHFYRNMQNKTVSFAEAKQNWELQPDWKSRLHRIGPGNEKNLKYMHPNKRFEAVFRPDGSLVRDPVNMGTYNYDPYTLGHFMHDMIPYYLCGNSVNDPTTVLQRIRSSF